jgi:hypothetical protein
VDIQPTSGYRPHVPSTPTDSPRGESLAEGHGEGAEGEVADAAVRPRGPGAYSSNARSVPERTRVSGTISVFA